MLEYPSVEIKLAVDPDEPSNSWERFHYKLDEIYKRFIGEVITDSLRCAIKESINSLCLSYLSEGIFPMRLWDLDHETDITFSYTNSVIIVPDWLGIWLETGIFMTDYEVREGLRRKKLLKEQEGKTGWFI